MLDEDLDERGHVVPELPLVEERDVSADVSAALEFPDALVDGRRGEADLLRQLRLRQLRIVLKQGEELPIDGVRAAVHYFDSVVWFHYLQLFGILVV